MNGREKIFIGLCDIASFINDWKSGFEANGLETYTGVYHKQHPFQNSPVDFTIETVQNKMGYFRPLTISSRLKPAWNRKVVDHYFSKSARTCDTFVFLWDNFFPDRRDYRLLKQKGKKIVTILVGDEVRWHPAMKQEFLAHNLPVIEYSDYDYSVKGLEARLYFLRNAEKYSDVILGQPNLMQLALRPYINLHIPIIASEFNHRPEQRKIPVVAHAPSDTAFKGTKYIEPVIKKLLDDGVKFEYKKIHGVPRTEALKMYEDCDIIVDQVLAPGGGKLAYEGLAMGKVVLTLMGYDRYDQKKPADCPLVDADPGSLYDVLKKHIEDVSLRQSISAKGRAYIQKYHDPKAICRQVTDILETGRIPEKDLMVPQFFRNEFIPESGESITAYNKWTQFVKGCDWYTNTVTPGERAGLVF